MVTTVRLPDELHRTLKEEAEKRGMTLNAYLISNLWNLHADGAGKTRKGEECVNTGRIERGWPEVSG